MAQPVPVAVPSTAFDVKEPTALHSPARDDGCALDQIASANAAAVTDVSRQGEVRFVGWSADTTNKTVPPVVVIELDGAKKYYAAAVRSTPRPDVAQTFGAPNLVTAGWDLLATFSSVDPGVYDVRVLGVSSAGDAVTCDAKRKLSVK
jgi:hypothetical protein